MAISFRHAPEQQRYEILDDDAVIGLAEYRRPDQSHVDFVHTEVDDAYGGQGLASKLVGFALEDVRTQGLRFLAHCPYVVKWLERHHEYDDLQDPV